MSGPTRPPLNTELNPILHTDRDHLLIYTFAYGDPQSLDNLEYFITEAIVHDTVADHVIIVQEGPSLKVSALCSGQQCLAVHHITTAAKKAGWGTPTVPKNVQY
jgi:hypothetical protein